MHTKSFFLRMTATLGVALLAGCQTTPPRPSLAPDLKLLEAAELELPRGCVASGSFVVSFTVGTSGRTDAIRAPNAPTCVQDALTAWIASFRYEPPKTATPASLEWMLVTAQRGS